MFLDRFWWFEGPGVSKSNSAYFFTPGGIFWRSGELWGAPGRQIYSPKKLFLKFGVLEIKFLAILDHLRVRHARHRIAEKKLVCAISRKLKNIFKTYSKLKRCGAILMLGQYMLRLLHVYIACMHVYIACIYCVHMLHSYIAYIHISICIYNLVIYTLVP